MPEWGHTLLGCVLVAVFSFALGARVGRRLILSICKQELPDRIYCRIAGLPSYRCTCGHNPVEIFHHPDCPCAEENKGDLTRAKQVAKSRTDA